MADNTVVFELDLDTKDAQKKSKNFQKSLKNVAKAGAAIAVGIGAGLAKLGNDFAKATDRVDKLSQRLGLSREGFQEWEFILSQSGVEIESMQSGMKSLSQRLQEATDGTSKSAAMFKTLGVEIKDADGNMKDQETLLNETVKALQGMEEGVEKAALAQKLFGRSGQELLPLLNSNSESIDEMKEQARDLGLVLSDDTISAGVELTDTFDQVKRAFDGAKTKATADLVPALLSIADFLIEKVIPAITDFITLLVAIPEWAEKNKTALMLIGTVLGTITALLIAYNIQQALANANLTIWGAISAAATAVTAALGGAFVFLTSPISLVILAIGALIAVGILLVRNWDKIKQTLINVGTVLKSFFVAVFEGIKKGLTSALNWVINKLNKFGVEPINILIKGINKVPGVNIPLIAKIPKLAKGGLAFGETLATVGDNPNASVDPEVIAPLSKLENMLGGGGKTIKIEQTPIILNLDGDEIAQALTPEVTRYIKVTGGNL